MYSSFLLYCPLSFSLTRVFLQDYYARIQVSGFTSMASALLHFTFLFPFPRALNCAPRGQTVFQRQHIIPFGISSGTLLEACSQMISWPSRLIARCAALCSVIRGFLKQPGGGWAKDLARSRIAALPRPEQNIIGQIDPCLHARMAPSGC